MIALGLAFSLAVSAMIAAKVDVPYLFRFLEIAGAVAAIGVMGYTGVLLSSMAAVEFWNTWLLVALFVVSAVSCGCAFISFSAFILSGSAQRFPALKGAAACCARRSLSCWSRSLRRGGWREAWRSGLANCCFRNSLQGSSGGGLVLCGFVIPVFADLIARVAPVRSCGR